MMLHETTIFIGSDHAGFTHKETIKNCLTQKNLKVVDLGPENENSVDYPDYAHAVAQRVNDGLGLGILFCGSGQGVNMTANKHQNVRSALCWSIDIALLSRQHNDANILSIPARFISSEETIKIVDVFLNTQFEGGRHKIRVGKITLKHQ
jgi:ribose 5-phosphate isomerase B